MKSYLHFALLILFFGFTPLFVYADEPVIDSATSTPNTASSTSATFDVQVIDTTLLEATTTDEVSTTTPQVQAVDVPSSCTVIDTNSVSHTFPQGDSPSEYLGVCMLETAKETGLIDFTLTNDPSFGLYIQSVNGIEPGATEYWAILYNGEMAACGIGCIPLSQDDMLSLVLTDWMTNVESTTIVLVVHSLVEPPAPPPQEPAPTSSGGGGNGGGVSHAQFNISSALTYLASAQHADGSFDSLFLSDWAALALAAADSGSAKAKLREYMLTATPSLSSITDYERHAMALEALGINPYSGTPVDYITPIVNAFDGTQIGDTSLDNDDLFALFPLLAAGYKTGDAVIAKTTTLLLSRQGQDGSWDGSIDMTAAAVQGLVQVQALSGVSTAIGAAKQYLHTAQQSNGGFGNSFSTSWVLQAAAALGESASSWTSSSFSPIEYLATLQQSDGGVEPTSSSAQTRVWATAYAIPAALGKAWPELLSSFAKPETKAIVSSGSAFLPATSTSTLVATSTPISLATSTLAIATSTPPVSVVVAEMPTPVAPLRTKKPNSVSRAVTPLESVVPTLIDQQTAAVANAPLDNFLAHLWGSISAFFRNIL